MPYRSKIFSLSTISEKLSDWKSHGKRIVFTNGCFDILHLGHVDYLEKAKALGDRLIVGINADHSVAKLKGNHRPIQNEQSRSSIIASLESVDAVLIFDQDTPLTLIQAIKPDVICKGGDWAIEQIVGSDFVLSYGGIVRSIPFIPGYSTSSIEQKILNQK